MSATENEPSTLAALECDGVVKEFDRVIVGGGYTTFKTQLIHWLKRRATADKIARQRRTVLKNISFKVMPGETVAIIGRNGAGKSTLLKLLTGIYKPTRGALKKRGRVSALLELGAGFHPEFSGRENIYVNGLILGLSRKELQKIEQQIIDFAELSDFIDAPVRTYSSGMYMRLAFAIAVTVEPDILIIDEILAVGDEHFQHKSKAKLDEFKRKRAAIVLVTHDLGTVETWANRAIWIEDGVIAADGEPRSVVQRYRDRVRQLEEEQRRRELATAEVAPPLPAAPAMVGRPGIDERWGDGAASIERVRILDDHGREKVMFDAGEPMTVEVEYELRAPLGDRPRLGIGLVMADGQCAFGTNTAIEQLSLPAYPRGRIRCRFAGLNVVARHLRVDVAIQSETGDHDFWSGVHRLDIIDDRPRAGILKLRSDWSFEPADTVGAGASLTSKHPSPRQSHEQ